MKNRIGALILALTMLLSMIPIMPTVADAAEVSTGPQITKVNMTLDAILGLNVTVAPGDIADMTGYNIQVKTEQETAYRLASAGVQQEDGSWKYTFKLLAHRMPEKMSIQLVDANGQVVDSKENWSISDYVAELNEQYYGWTNLNDLSLDMLNYGAYAAYHQGGADPNVSAVTSVKKEDLSGSYMTLSTLDEALDASVRLYLDEACDIRVYVNTAAVEGCTMTVTDTVSNQVVSHGEVTSGERTYYSVSGIRPENYDKQYKFVVTNAQGETLLDLSYSVLAYIQNKMDITTNQKLNSLIKAMYLYHTAAQTYMVAPNATAEIYRNPETGAYTMKGSSDGAANGFYYKMVTEEAAKGFEIVADLSTTVADHDYGDGWQYDSYTGLGFVLQQDDKVVHFVYDKSWDIHPMSNGVQYSCDHGICGTDYGVNFGSLFAQANTAYKLKLRYDNGILVFSKWDGSAWVALHTTPYSVSNIGFDPAKGVTVGIGNYLGTGFDGPDKTAGGTVSNVTLQTLTPYTITYETGNGTLAENAPTTYTYGTAATVTLPEATKEGYTFIGWFDAATNGNKLTTLEGKTGDITLYAHWIASMNLANGIYTTTDNTAYNYQVIGTNTNDFDLQVTITSTQEKTHAGFVVEQGGHSVMLRQKPYYEGVDDYINTVWDWNESDTVNIWKQIPGIPTFAKDTPVTMRLTCTNGVFKLYTSDGNGGWTLLQEMTVEYFTNPSTGTAAGSNGQSQRFTFDAAQPFTVGFATSPINTPSAATFSNVVFVDFDNDAKHTITYQDVYGEAVTTANPTEIYEGQTITLAGLSGADFVGWFDESGNQVTQLSNITSNITLTAKRSTMFSQIPLRDPFILNDNGTYYLYGTGGYGKFSVWSSTDLETWVIEGNCFETEMDANNILYPTEDSIFWAPEVYKYTDGKYYMFATFTNTAGNGYNATAILRADSPKGPFNIWSKDASGNPAFVTPADHSALDGTLFIEDGVPYMVYAHEWECSCRNGTGSMDYIQLKNDLSGIADGANSVELFNASALTDISWWESTFGGKDDATVTDGPFVYTDKNNQNYILWSTSIDYNYIVAATKFGKLTDGSINVKDNSTQIYTEDGGHAMIFTDANGTDKLILHTPNTGTSYPALFTVNTANGALSLEGIRIWDGYGVDKAPQLGNKGYTANTTFFIGDSFFDNAFWDNFHKDLAGKDAVIAGIGGTTSEDWSQYIAKGYIFSSNVAPKNIVINLGNNDVYTDRLGADEACANLQSLLNTLKTKYPSTGIYLFSITPRTDDSTTVLNAVNTAMSTWCSSNGVTFVDISSYTMKLTDGIHPADAHYNDVFLAALQSAGCTIADKTSMLGDTSGMTYADGVYSALNPNIYNWHFMDTTYDNFELEMTVTPLTDSTYAGFVVAQNGHTVMIRQKPYYQYQSTAANDNYINTVWDWNWADSVNVWKQIPNIPTFKINEPVTMKLSYIGGVFNLYVSDGNGGWTHLQQMTVDYLTDPAVGTSASGNTGKYITFDPAQTFAVGFATAPIYPSAATFSNVKLTQITAYTISYELGGGVLDGNQPTSYTNATAGEIVLPTPTREHYTFQGWYIGETKVESLEGYTESLTLTAKWAPAKSNGMTLSGGVYTDSTSGNNYSYWFMDGEASNFDLQMTVTAGTTNTFGGFVVRQGDNVVLIRQKAAGQDDYINTVFNWQTGEGSNGNAWKQIVGIPTFANGTPVTMRLTLVDGTFTLYTSNGSGGWTKLQDMSVTYLTDPTVGTNAGGANSVGCTLDASKPFEVGFATDRIYDAAGTTITNVIYSVDSVVVNEWSISYNTDGGTNPSSAPATYTAETAATVVLPTPTKSGYLFMGWYDESGTYIASLAGKTGIINLTAQWVQENYNITANNGVYTANNTSAAFNYHMVDTQFSNDFELEVDIINGNNNAGFVGFIVQQGGNNVTIRMKGNEGDKCFDFYYNHGTDGGRWHVNNAIPAFPQNTVVRMKLAYSNGTFTVYKQDGSSWTKIQDMTLDYLTSGAGMPGGSQSGAWGNLPSFTFDATKPFAVGFGGFHGDGANGINSTFQNVKFTDRSNLTEYSISYDLGGGEVVGTAPTSYNDTNADSIVLPGATRSGYVFMGWYIGSDYVTNLSGRSGTVTLTAKWLDQTGCGYEGTIYPDEYEISYSNGVYSCGSGHQFNYYYMDKASKDFELTVTFNMDAQAPNNMGFVISQGEGKTQFIQLSNNSGNLWCDIFPNFTNSNNNWFESGTYVAPGTSVTLKLAYSNSAFTLKDANGTTLKTLSLEEITGNLGGGAAAGFTYDPNLPFAVGFGNRYAYGTFTNVTYTDNTAN